MCFRHLEADHPANRGRDFDPKATAIEKLYRDMDDLVGRVIARLKSGDVLMVMSDHGFKSFRRGVNLNTFLLRNGFLCLKENSKGGDMFAGVDWARTKAYAVGFGGIYLNVKGRESDGIVEPEAAGAVKREIAERLKALYDEKERVEPVREVYDSREVYCGPYAADAPDLIVGFRPGHRVAWSSVTGGFSEEIIEDNARPWSGDHNFNPPDVPGILFANRRFAPSPRIVDIGPTVLDLFGVSIPKWCDGRSIVPTGAERQREEDSQHKDAKDAKDGKDTEDGKDAEKESAVVS
jgi:predicted AlkP superfamily phosphohydrolase/phosphomutase